MLALRLRANGQTAEKAGVADDSLTALGKQLPASQAEDLSRLLSAYEKKTETEKQEWREQIENFVGRDERSVDDSVHWSHVEAALREEIPLVRDIVIPAMTASRRSRFEKELSETENATPSANEWLQKSVRNAFFRRLVSLRDLPAPTVFDRLGGAEFVRLVRLSGIWEVALACVRIEAVESIAAFLRRFSPEDARAIAARLNALPATSEERIAFAENLVQTILEAETNPTAMLDLLGFRLVGILLCDATPQRIAYAAQKLPLEIAPGLSEIIETDCRQIPVALRREIAAEIERLAETVNETAVKIR